MSTEVLLYAYVSAVKSLCALRLDLSAVSFRAKLLSGHWIDTPFDYSPAYKSSMTSSESKAGPIPNSRRSTRILKSSSVIGAKGSADAAMAGAKQRRKPLDDSAILSRSSETSRDSRPYRRSTSRSLYNPTRLHASTSMTMLSMAATVPEEDVMVDDEEDAPTSPTGYAGDDDGEDVFDRKVLSRIAQQSQVAIDGWYLDNGSDSCALELSSLTDDSPPSVSALLRYQEGEKVLADQHSRFVSYLGRFIRLESHTREWVMRERAVVLEQDLQRELHEVESEALALQW